MNTERLIPSKEVCSLIAKAAAAEERAKSLLRKATQSMREEAAAKGRTQGYTKEIIADLLNEEPGIGINEALGDRDAEHANALIRSRMKAAKAAAAKAATEAVDSIRAA